MEQSPLSHVRLFLILPAMLLLLGPCAESPAQRATISETVQTFRTYPFSDPDPVARMSNIYPYFRYQGYSMTPVDRPWKVVTLENRFIRVLVAPEIGGKILGAFEKSTGREFIYYNRVMKFREIAMRGPWTSGGIEFNFGDIGHTPATATPVDYLTRTNADGSVSCIVGALDLPSRTEWRVEIRLPPDRAVVETRSLWYNPTAVSTSLYHWMNAAAGADSTLQLIYPGNTYISHGGEVSPWPVDTQGRDLSWYQNNAFGSYKSYHVLGAFTDYFGARWNDFGVIHWSRYTDKPGKKLWIWGLSREGEIWKGLLTDSSLGNTQYVELQSGLHFNQAVMQSSRTPFKHMTFLPQTSERFNETWFPFRNLGGVTRATPDGVLHVRASNGVLHFGFCPTGKSTQVITVTIEGKPCFSRSVELQPLQVVQDSVVAGRPDGDVEIHIGNLLHYRSSDDTARLLERPVKEETPFDWNSAYGLAVDARERVRQRDPKGALESYRASLHKDPEFLPALSGSAELYLRRMDHDSALAFTKRSLTVDTYDPESNYLYGLAQRSLGKPYDARDGFGIAARSAAYRPAAYLQLAEMAFIEGQWDDAEEFALRASRAGADNIPALQLRSLAAVHRRDSAAVSEFISDILAIDPLNHCARFVAYRLAPTPESRDAFVGMIRNELPQESFLELATYFARLGLTGDALEILSLAPDHPMVLLWRAYLESRSGRIQKSAQLLDSALAASPQLVFPHRQEDREVLLWAEQRAHHWKILYYRALLAWSLGRKEEAGTLLAACEDTPDFGPFYLSRAGFWADAPQRALQDYRKAVQVDPGEWRTYNALATFLNAQGQYVEALRVCEHAVERFPHSYVLEFLLARTLLFNEKYGAGHAILDTLTILPFEGARYGHDAYRQACILLAAQKSLQNDVEGALALMRQARLWPERLGAGRPYDVDTRLEDYLEAFLLKQKGDQEGSAVLLSKVCKYTRNRSTPGSASKLAGALALRASGKTREAQTRLEEWKRKEPASDIARWSLEVFNKHREKALALERGLQTTLLNKSSGDQEFVLLAQVVHMLRW